MTETDLATIEQRVNAATLGPWVTDRNHQHDPWITSTVAVDIDGDPQYIAQTTYDRQSWSERPTEKADAEFIAHARTDVPALIAEVRRLRAEMVRCRA